MQITDHSCDITNCHNLTRDIADPNFNFILCLEFEVYAQRANLCFFKTLKKINNFSFYQTGIEPLY